MSFVMLIYIAVRMLPQNHMTFAKQKQLQSLKKGSKYLCRLSKNYCRYKVPLSY
jgi:hypothetical protein